MDLFLTDQEIDVLITEEKRTNVLLQKGMYYTAPMGLKLFCFLSFL
jgi:hypothetical protein